MFTSNTTQDNKRMEPGDELAHMESTKGLFANAQKSPPSAATTYTIAASAFSRVRIA